MGRDISSNIGRYHQLLRKSWFSELPYGLAEPIVSAIDESIESGDIDKAVSLMKAVDTLCESIPLEGIEPLIKDDADEDREVLDKGRLPALAGEVRSMDVSGNESVSGQKRRQVKKMHGGGWAKEPKPAPGDNINPKDTYLERER